MEKRITKTDLKKTLEDSFFNSFNELSRFPAGEDTKDQLEKHEIPAIVHRSPLVSVTEMHPIREMRSIYLLLV